MGLSGAGKDGSGGLGGGWKDVVGGGGGGRECKGVRGSRLWFEMKVMVMVWLGV